MNDTARMIAVDDTTSLAGPVVDVAARIGWTLRMARTTAHVADTRMRSLAEAIGTSPARLSRAETGQLRDGEVVDGYERVLGLPVGSLRAPVDVMCRTFPSASPPDSRPGSPIAGVEELSVLTERLAGEDDVTGGDWLRWARAIAAPGNIGLPTSLARPLVRRLAHELARSVGHAHPTRYEALALLRCSPYGTVVLDEARAELADPDAQAGGDLASAVGEAVSADAVDWCLALLLDASPYRAACGALALENMAEITGPSFWQHHRLAPRLLETFDRVPAEAPQEETVAHLVRLVPRAVWAALGRTPSRPLPPAPEVAGFDRGATNRHWRRCREASLEVSRDLGLPDQPMLSRLLFDIGVGHWETRAATASMLVGALPALARPVAERLAAMVDDETDTGLRHRLARRLVMALHGDRSEVVEGWASSPDPALRTAALQAYGSAGVAAPVEVLRAALADPRTRRAATLAAGMARHPEVPRLLEDPALDPTARSWLAWWDVRGGRLTV